MSNTSNAVEAGRGTSPDIADDDEPIDIPKARELVPWWPYGTDGTYRLIRQGTLGAIKIGPRRRFVTRRLLRECLARHTVAGGAQNGGAR